MIDQLRFEYGTLVRRIFGLSLLGCAMFVFGCEQYVTPGGPADLAEFADPEIKEVLKRKPAAEFPVNLAMVRLQESGYYNEGYMGYGRGSFSTMLSGDVETEEHLNRIGAWPEVSRVVKLSRLVIPNKLESEKDLRQAAARLHADLLLIYTFDTQFHIDERIEPATTLTLGLLPNKQARVVTHGSSMIVDTQTGYVYGTADAEGRHEQLANSWTTSEAVDDAREKTEEEAFESLLDETERLWERIVDQRSGQQEVAERPEAQG